MTARRRAYALAVAGGLVGSLACPPVSFGPAIAPGLVLLALALRDAPSARAAFLRALAWATVGGAAGMSFVPEAMQRFSDLGWPVGVLALVLLALAQAVAWGIGALAAFLLARRAGVPAPFAFGAGVFVASQLPLVFGWTPGALLSDVPELVQLGEYVGDRGVSFVAGLVAGLAASAVGASPRTAAVRGGAAVAIALLVAAFGAWRIASLDLEGRETLRVALVEQAAPPDADRTDAEAAPQLDRLRALSAAAERDGADLIVWPEAAYPYELARPLTSFAPDDRSPLTPEARVPRLIGLVTVDGEDRFNSATLALPGGAAQEPYDKLALLWFGETPPFGERFGFVRAAFERPRHVEPGTAARGLALPPGAGGRPSRPLSLGVLICYEDTRSGFGRRVAREAEPDLLVNVSNDAWFAGTAAPELQARLAVMRAVETRTDLVRAVNGGDSSWVDALGRVRARREGGEPGVLVATPALRPAGASPTLFVRFGDAPVWALVALVTAAAWLRRRRERTRPTSSSSPS